MSSFRDWLDRTPLASMALSLMRDATGRAEPLAPVRPARPVALAARARVGFWSLSAGCGTSTLAALVAHRSAAAGSTPLLLDLDRWTPSLALRAKIDGATIADALLRPGRELESVSRWAGVPFLPGSPGLHAQFDGERVGAAMDRAAQQRAIVIDLGAGADALDAAVLSRLTTLAVVAGTRCAQLQAAFCAVPLVREIPCRVVLVVVGAAAEDATAIAARLPWPLVAAIPPDPYLASDEYAAKAPTLRAVDAVIAGCA